MNVDTAAKFLTIISLCTGILIAISTLAWRISRTLNKLLELPAEVREVVEELKKMNRKIGEVRGESESWRRESNNWHQQHMERNHRQRGRQI